MTTATCKHELPIGSCAACKGVPRDRLQERIDEETDTCSSRKCGAEIVWAVTERGRNMPVDVDPVPGGTVELYLEGGLLRCRVLSAKREAGHGQQSLSGAGVELRTSHFATCVDAESYRTREDA